MLKSTLYGCIMGAFFATCATAADVPVKSVSVVQSSPADLFKGWTFGLEAGYGMNTTNAELGGVPNVKPDGFIGGASIGYRGLVAARTYLGIETAFYGADLKDSIAIGGTSATAKQNWLGRTVLSVGYAVMPDLLVYADGGVAYGNTKVSIAGTPLSDSQTSVGWTLGAGVDYALTQYGMSGWSLGARYAYIDLGTSSYCANLGGICLGIPAKTTENLALVNLKWRFGL